MLIVYNWWDKVKTFEIFKIHQQMTKYGCSQFPYNTHKKSLYTVFLLFYVNWFFFLKYYLKLMLLVYNWLMR